MTPGQRLGPYEIVAKLGAGGMGEVYRARDTRLDRTVAVKVLPAGFAADPAARERFDREARAISQIDHPHICTLHDVGTENGVAYLVMQLVAGETLADRVARAPLSVPEASHIARQIADALDAAHERGIVHRDLKPANVMVSDRNEVKVLDFGLAKDYTASPNASMSPTMIGATAAGVMLGTAAYMSPEQARGKEVDKRTDVWAFGCVLYEMLTGQQAFTGETVTDVLAAIVHKEPEWALLPAGTPPHIRRLIVRCLRKDLRQRLRDIGDARLEFEHNDADAGQDASPLSRRASLTVPLVLALALSVLTGIVAFGIGVRNRTAAPALENGVTRLTMPLSPPAHLGFPQPSMAFSPDGRVFAYTGSQPNQPFGLWLRRIDGEESRPIPRSTGRNVIFSPDGQSVAATSADGIMRYPLGLGAPIQVCKCPNVSGATWTARDEIVFANPATGLWRVAAAGGTPSRIAEGPFVYPDSLPGGRHVVVTTDNPSARSSDELRIAVVDIDTGEVRTLFDGGTYARYAPTGHLVYLRQNALVAVPFDASSLTVLGAPETVVSNVYMNPLVASGNYAFSPSGTLAYVAGDGTEFIRSLITIAPSGERRALSASRGNYGTSARMSPDGRRVAVVIGAMRADSVWTLDLARDTLSRLSHEDYAVRSPVWSPDGRRLAVAAAKVREATSLYLLPADPGGAMERVTTSRRNQRPLSWTPDGKGLVFEEEGDLWLVALEGDRDPRPLTRTEFLESAARVSPDGRWMVYESNRGGDWAINITDFPALTRTVEIGPGRLPEWARDGRRIFYRLGRDIAAVDVSRGGTVSTEPVAVSKPTTIVQMPAGPPEPFDVTPENTFLTLDSYGGGGGATELKVILHWFQELKPRVAAR